MAMERVSPEDQRDENDPDTHGPNRHGTMADGEDEATKGSSYENSGPNDDARNAGGPANPHLAADQDTVTGRM